MRIVRPTGTSPVEAASFAWRFLAEIMLSTGTSPVGQTARMTGAAPVGASESDAIHMRLPDRIHALAQGL